MKIFIETSVFIRFLSQDDIKKYKDVSRLIEMIQEGKATPYISSMVITEIVFVLTRLYQFSKDKVLAALTGLVGIERGSFE